LPHHRRRPSHRKAPNPRASWLVPGFSNVTAILHQGRTAHLIPVKARDHRKRYATGQRLAVKPYIPGPTECHVILTSVKGPGDLFSLGDVDYATARSLGYVRLDDFRLAWVEENDPAWWGHWNDGAEPTDAILERFEQRWSGKLAWLLHFRIDTAAAPPRLIARNGGHGATYRQGADGRWQYVERAEDAEADRGYTSTTAHSDPEEPEALTDHEWKLHVDANRDLTHDQWVALGRVTKLNEKRRRPPKHLRNAA
jgi:hypothetical protein